MTRFFVQSHCKFDTFILSRRKAHGLYARDGRRFWLEFDDATQGDPDFGALIRSAGRFGVQSDYRQTRTAGTYPAAFRQKFLPKREDWKSIAKLQTDMIGSLLDNDWSNVQAAFEDFGQGQLFDNDPRRDDGNRIHMMDGQLAHNSSDITDGTPQSA